MSIKLINPRGRVVVVDDGEEYRISELLNQGFLFPPTDQKNIYYSQVHDRGDKIERTSRVKRSQIVSIEKLGDTLEVEEL